MINNLKQIIYIGSQILNHTEKDTKEGKSGLAVIAWNSDGWNALYSPKLPKAKVAKTLQEYLDSLDVESEDLREEILNCLKSMRRR